MSKPLSVILIGAGNRGELYTDIMLEMPEQFRVVAVAEPIESRRKNVAQKHGIPPERCFVDWRQLLELGKIADMAVIATMDQQHYEPVLAAIDLKYDILLEKPISPSPQECCEMAHCADAAGVKIVVCHVLRYTPLFMKLKDLIDEGKVGRVMSINHEECVGNVHQSHSFVRGNWGNSERSSCMLLQKSCHDMDILQWLIGKKCKKVQSFGTLSYFRAENAPVGAPDYCIQGCPAGETCPYNAVKLYLDDEKNDWFRTTCTREANPTDEMVQRAISTTQYGKCVFRCDNDVVDHQTVNMLFEDDITVTFTMNAFNKGGRFIHIMGSGGEIRAAMDGDQPIELYDFVTKQVIEIPMSGKDGIASGHGGGDKGIVQSLYTYLTTGDGGKSISGISESCDNHLLVFAAEQSRHSGRVIDFAEFTETL